MSREHKSLWVIITFLAIFAIGGFLHVFFYGVDWVTSLFQLYYCIVVLLWGSSLQQRIIEKRTKRLMTAIVIFLLSFFILQAGRYAMLSIDAIVARRYIWYAYYVVYTLVPFLFLQAAVQLNYGEDEKINPIHYVIYAIAFVECVMVVTNDLHELFFYFPDGLINSDDSYKYAILYYVFLGTYCVAYIASLIIVFIKCSVETCKRMIWLPLVFSLTGVTGIFCSYSGRLPSINGVRIWTDGEILSLLVMGIIESCIQIGLIPSNTYYNRFFGVVNDPIIIRDNDQRIRFSTKTAKKGIQETEDVRVYTENISGGTVSYGVDISALNKLNRELDEATEKIKIRNEYLKSQNDLKEEQIKLQTRNEIYDRIAEIVKPELDKTLELSQNPDSESFNKDLAKIAFYNAYIKRRSNMELLKAESELLSVKELSTAVIESIEYLKLSDVQGMARISGWQELPADMIILFYEFFQYVTEKCFDSLSEIFVTLRHKEEIYTINLVLKTDSSDFDTNWRAEELDPYEGKITVSDDEDGIIVALSLNEGGALS